MTISQNDIRPTRPPHAHVLLTPAVIVISGQVNLGDLAA